MRISDWSSDVCSSDLYIPDMKKQMEKKARPPKGAAADWTIPQNWPHLTAQDHATWDRLFARQSALLTGRASDAYLRGLDMLRSEESRVGKEGVSQCRARGSAYH